MTRTLAGLAGALCLGLLASVAQAAPLGSVGDSRSVAISSDLVRVHGIHITCRRDKYGWHRSHVWGRERCVPKRYKPWYRWWR
jgi:hypothetical protein